MKKRIFSLMLALFLLFLTSCTPAEEEETSEELFTPLLRFVVEEGSENKLQLFSMPLSDGVFYLHPSAEEGFSGGFVSLNRSISSESVVNETASLSFAYIRETAADRAILVSSAGISNLLLKENFSETMPLPEKYSLRTGVFYDELTMIGETEELLLLCPLDLSQTYVLAKKSEIASYKDVLCVTGEGSRIWYALEGETEDSYGGIAYFEKGKTESLGVEKFPFDEFVPVGSTGVLFIRHLEDGGALYLYRNLGGRVGGAYTADKPFDAVTCSENGAVLAGVYNNGSDGSVVVVDLAAGKEKFTYVPEMGAPSPALALSGDGTSLYMAVSGGGEEILGILSIS